MRAHYYILCPKGRFQITSMDYFDQVNTVFSNDKGGIQHNES